MACLISGQVHATLYSVVGSLHIVVGDDVVDDYKTVFGVDIGSLQRDRVVRCAVCAIFAEDVCGPADGRVAVSAARALSATGTAQPSSTR